MTVFPPLFGRGGNRSAECCFQPSGCRSEVFNECAFGGARRKKQNQSARAEVLVFLLVLKGMKRDAAKEWTASTRTGEGCIWHSLGSTRSVKGNVVLKECKKKRQWQRGLWGSIFGAVGDAV
jgi:hypothetical protein